MKIIHDHIARRQAAWRQNPFFALLERQTDIAFLAEFARRLTFWPLVFQDVLRALAETVHETGLAKIARHHAAEDRDHDLWFLHDIAALGVRIPDANELFRADHEAARRAAYAIMAEALKARSSVERIVVLLALESTGHIFFTATARCVERCRVRGLKYFSEEHLLVEQGHALFEDRANDLLRRMTLGDAERASAIAVADACFDAIEMMFARILAPQPALYLPARSASVLTSASSSPL